MLQLPQSPTTPRFSRSHLTDVKRGVAVKIGIAKPKPDPIIPLIARAEAALETYIDAVNARWTIEQTIDKNDRFSACVSVPDELLNVHWRSGFLFHSEQQVEQQFRAAIQHIGKELREERAIYKKAAPKKERACSNYEREQRMASYERKLLLLSKMKEPMKKALRKEDRRIATLHRKTGLFAAREATRLATRELHIVTLMMKKARPISALGALALVGYVERRLDGERPSLFTEEGYFPSAMGPLLRRAQAVLAKALK